MSNETELTLQNVHHLILNELRNHGKSEEIGTTDELIGVVDSMTMVGIIGSLEENFRITIDGEMLTIENFSSVDSIYRMLEKAVQDSDKSG